MLARFIRFPVFFVCAVVLCAAGGVQLSGVNTQTSDANNVTGDTQSKIRALIDQYLTALQERDLGALDTIWADDLTFVNPYGDLLNKKNRMDNVKSGATAFKSIKLSEVDVRMFGQAAVATFKIVTEAHYSGHESSGDYRVTTVWAPSKDTWKLVAVHMTLMK